MRVAIYARVSLDKTGEEHAVERQLAECEDRAAQLKATDIVTYVDNDVSAFSGAIRPNFEKLLTHLGQGRFDCLIAAHPDRLYRRLADLGRVIEAAQNVQIVTLAAGDIDLSTASGRLNANILASVAQAESERHAERRITANKARRAAGAWRKEGSRPFGFDADGTHREPEASMIAEAVRDILSGVSIHAIARRWNEAGVTTVRGKRWTNLHVRRVLSNARIAALVVHKGEIVGPGNWGAIVDETLWRALQSLFTTRASAMAFERTHLLSGVALCGTCGRPLYARYAHGRERTPTYVCRASHVARSVPPLDKMVEGLVVQHLTVQGVERDLLSTPDTAIIALEERRAALTTTRGSLAGLLRKGLLTEEDVTADAMAIQRELDEIDQKIADRRPALVLLDGELLDRWENGTVETKAAIVDMLMWIVVYPAPHGQRNFDPSLVWRRFR